ncbi:hypothetical protein STCU_12248 [Strigomonas culicis]|uniref:Uncharacterized protein n=1 Tax=Strigomonas culicis TaxID=28005 RepID=S9UKM7_9TRYP|nr:hypothetical protein STCU_12248 [Strigomonas culicis]|eukprot:EPY15206.1 hypothetical protein STCU_12248 [Strigomonas culicis]
MDIATPKALLHVHRVLRQSSDQSLSPTPLRVYGKELFSTPDVHGAHLWNSNTAPPHTRARSHSILSLDNGPTPLRSTPASDDPRLAPCGLGVADADALSNEEEPFSVNLFVPLGSGCLTDHTADRYAELSEAEEDEAEAAAAEAAALYDVIATAQQMLAVPAADALAAARHPALAEEARYWRDKSELLQGQIIEKEMLLQHEYRLRERAARRTRSPSLSDASAADRTLEPLTRDECDARRRLVGAEEEQFFELLGHFLRDVLRRAPLLADMPDLAHYPTILRPGSVVINSALEAELVDLRQQLQAATARIEELSEINAELLWALRGHQNLSK